MKEKGAEIPLYLWESFIAVVEERTLQKAANRLHTTQPTITRHLHQLEESLPLKLFELRGRTKKPTPVAIELHRKLKSRLQFLPEDIRQSVLAHAEGRTLHLNVAGSRESLRTFLKDVNTKMPITLQIKSELDLHQAAKEEQFEVIFHSEPWALSKFTTRKLSQQEWFLVVPKKFMRSSKDLSDWKERSAKFPLAVFTKDHFALKEWRHTSSSFEIADWEILEERVHQGLNWTVLPKTVLKASGNYLVKPLTQIKDRQDFYLSYRKDLIKHPEFKDLIQQIEQKKPGVR